ncbi:unnamed protein product [Gongylonema pulchrum]|uniref:Uncharacterized protein n=1 Tax=Gongylonema pulchrum TaxID=637853 RepID=A0A3P6TDB3_9BILA|nr:unnamed protein product [Gongylonema pulchrum]
MRPKRKLFFFRPAAAHTDFAPKLGFPCQLPDDLVNELEIQARFDSQDKAGVSLTKTMLVLRIEESSIFFGKLKICDFITRLEGEQLVSKKHFYDKLKALRHAGKEVCCD